MTVLTTIRLRLEPFAEAHFDGLQTMNRDPAVMRYITGRPETPEETRAAIERVQKRWAEWGYSWWALIEQASGELVGAACLQHLAGDRANPHEIGWRLRPEYWRQGYASEAAREIAAFAFGTVGVPLLRAICDQANTASARVMQRLGMRYCGVERWYDCDTAAYEMTREEWHETPDRRG